MLISTWAWRSHYYPLVPLTWGLLAAGHEVRVATQPALVQAVTATGAPAVAVGRDLDFTKDFAGMFGGVADEEPGQDGMAAAVTADGGAVRYAEAVVDDLVAFGRVFRPDVLVHEPFNLAGAVAAQALGVPVVKHLWAADFSETIPVEEAVATGDLVRRFGLDRLRTDSDLVLDPCPPAMQFPGGRSPRQPIRFVPYNGTAEVPDWLLAPPSRPRVCVTWGTLMSEMDDDRVFLAPRVAKALSELDVEVVVTTDPRAHAKFAGLPDTVHIAQKPLALHLLLPSCVAVVHQGGAGTTMTALAAGVPQLVLPTVGDQRFNANQLAATGAGALGSVDKVAEQIAGLLTDDATSAAAAELARENAERPTPGQIAAELPRLLA
ncbi:UDP:flavonoid glycosyltransferase YjiC, YdhE family [Allokutzneria albata]|uniref:UDP:flavonoid glycosyltransferase YjiC, YdhE family n=1 Tax=Allokutzneria albata TaxID=211114 RepID=A0A1G9U7X7_ALLAB|nr:UDP:flavonoid glycosyltransferase YjiC, YdhE family [Allokutzneria albata]